MTAIRFATNKTKLVQCLGISRTLLYQFMRLPDAPAPCADGRWTSEHSESSSRRNVSRLKRPKRSSFKSCCLEQDWNANNTSSLKCDKRHAKRFAPT